MALKTTSTARGARAQGLCLFLGRSGLGGAHVEATWAQLLKSELRASACFGLVGSNVVCFCYGSPEGHPVHLSGPPTVHTNLPDTHTVSLLMYSQLRDLVV